MGNWGQIFFLDNYNGRTTQALTSPSFPEISLFFNHKLFRETPCQTK